MIFWLFSRVFDKSRYKVTRESDILTSSDIREYETLRFFIQVNI